MRIAKTIGDELQIISSQDEKGQLFENLVIKTLENSSEYELKRVYHWNNWPDRQRLVRESEEDLGIDLVAVHNNGQFIAIQCKCYPNSTISKGDIDSFLAESQRVDVFAQRWIVTVGDWSPKAEKQITGLTPPVKRINFLQHSHELLVEKSKLNTQQIALRPKQQAALNNVVKGFTNHDRGRLIMACGTGKTFTALRIAEKIVKTGGGEFYLLPQVSP